MTSSVQQHIDRFFEGASHKCTSVLSVDTVTSDSHEMTFSRHYVTEQGKVTVVHVQTVELQDSVHFFLYRLTDSLNTQYLEYLTNVVTECPNRIYISLRQYFHQ